MTFDAFNKTYSKLRKAISEVKGYVDAGNIGEAQKSLGRLELYLDEASYVLNPVKFNGISDNLRHIMESNPQSLPPYQKVAYGILQRINQDVYKRGEPIPTRNKLEWEFGVSGAPVAHALEMLYMDHVLIRRRSSSPIVNPDYEYRFAS